MQDYVPVENGELYFEAQGEGPAVLFLHAGVADHTQWEPQLEPFTAAHHVITYDMRGFGRSRTQSAPFSNRQDIHDLLTYLNIDKATLVGNSRGGSIALDFTLEHPEMVSALVWVCGGVSGYHSEANVPPDETAYFEHLETIWESKDWAALADLEANVWANGFGQPADRAPEQVRAKVRQMIYDGYTRQDGEGQPRPLENLAVDRLHELTCPVLVIIGDLDTTGTRASADYLAKTLPNAEVVHFPNAAHMVSMEEPGRFNSVVLDFLQRHGL